MIVNVDVKVVPQLSTASASADDAPGTPQLRVGEGAAVQRKVARQTRRQMLECCALSTAGVKVPHGPVEDGHEELEG
jgi:hypothetical protein